MTLWDKWTTHPQSLWVRKALFQIHRCTGIGVGLYILLMSGSGSLIVYRDELSLTFSRAPIFVTGEGRRMTREALSQVAQARHPGYTVVEIYERQNPKQAVEISFDYAGKRLERLYDPYTGEDLGNRLRDGFRLLLWLVSLHENLLSGQTGRLVNGIGGSLLTLLALTGSVIWWPGNRSWGHSISIDSKAGFKRYLWTLHSVLGFWFYGFVLLWGVSGVYLCFPSVFTVVLDFFDPLIPGSRVPRAGDIALFWLSRLHFGRFAGGFVKTIWTAAGLVPAALFLTGAVMWWNRVLRPRLRQWKRSA